jgi:hypothetical protein
MAKFDFSDLLPVFNPDELAMFMRAFVANKREPIALVYSRTRLGKSTLINSLAPAADDVPSVPADQANALSVDSNETLINLFVRMFAEFATEEEVKQVTENGGDYDKELFAARLAHKGPLDILRIDDCTGVYKDVECREFLMKITENRTLPDGSLAPRQAHYGKKPHELARIGGKQSFTFTGQVILLTNNVHHAGTFLGALKGRGTMLRLIYSNPVIHEY